MQTMFLLAPFAILSLGMLGLALCLWRRIPYAGLVAMLTAIGAWLAVMSWSLRLPLSLSLSTWPAAFSSRQIGLTFTVDGLGWVMAMTHLSLSIIIFLTGFARPGGQRIRVRMAALLMTYAGLAVFLSQDVVTRLFAWTGLDLIVFLVYALLARGDALPPQAVRQLTFNALSSGLVLVGAISAGSAGNESLVTSSATTSTLMLAAAAFRLGLFPLHVALPGPAEVRQGLAVQLRLVPALAGFEWLCRLTGSGFNPDVGVAVSLLGIFAAWTGAVQIWNSVNARDALPSLVIAASGIAAIASQWVGLTALITLALTLALGGGLLFLSRGMDRQRRWLNVIPFFGLAALLGLPGTPGFLVLTEIASAVRTTSGLAWLWLLACGSAWIVVGAGLWRVLSWPAEPLQGARVGLGLYVAGGVIAALIILTTGIGAAALSALTGVRTIELTPGDAPDLILAAGFAALITGLSFLLWRSENVLRLVVEGWSRSGPGVLIGSIFRSDGPVRMVWWLVASVSRLVGAGVMILEGTGGPFWMIAFIVAVALAFRP